MAGETDSGERTDVMRNIGIVLLVLGAIALIYGGINYNRSRTVLEMGSMSVTATEHKDVSVPVVVGVVVLIGGVGLLVAGKRSSAPR
jgi:uncharacterized membrane protein YidH (DUF202 family)